MTSVRTRRLDERGSVSIAIYAHNGTPQERTTWHTAQARVALDRGFDGVTVSEHHAGFPGYMPTPVLAAARILALSNRGWAGPCPLLLPLRHPALVAEELAWLAAMHPGRVAAGVAAGYSEQDFAVVGAERTASGRELRSRATALRQVAVPGAPLEHDDAVRELLPTVPLVMCTGGPRTAAHAAGLGMGLMLPPQDPARNAESMTAYLDAGGSGPRVIGQWIWLGAPPRDGLEALSAAYPAVDAAGTRKYAPAVMHASDAGELVEALWQVIDSLALTGMNLRVHLPGVDPQTTLEQIERVAEDVVPLLHDRFEYNQQNTIEKESTLP